MAQHFHSLCFHQQVLLKLQTRHGGRHKGVTRRLQQRWNGKQGLGFVLSQSLAPLLYMESMERVIPEQQAQTGLSQLWVQNLALLTTGAELEFSQALSVSKLSSTGHSTTKTIQFQEKRISIYFSRSLWLLTRTKSTGCSTTKDCLMSYLIKCYFYCFLCFPPQWWKEHGGEDDMILKLRIPHKQTISNCSIQQKAKNKIILFAPCSWVALK